MIGLALQPAAAIPCAKTQSQSQTQSAEASWVEATLAALTVDEKIGQLLIPAAVGAFLPQDGAAFQEIKRNLNEFHVGGYHMLGETNSLHEPADVALLLNHMQKLARIPLWITADFEGGVGLRYVGATRLPRGMALGATGSEAFAREAGRITAEEARALGVHVNFYPVVDVNNNARNPIINIRSFGGDPRLVARMARAYIDGAQSNGMMATAKHFPGHGDTSFDSHLELPSLDLDRARLDSIELIPFKAAIDAGAGGVMSAHIALPFIDPERVPATLSSKILSGLLRGELGFRGVIFTDAMNMRGIVAHFPDGEAAVRAVKAGADIILYPPDVGAAFRALKRAVDSGEIPAVRIDESVRRVLAAKARLGLDKNRLTDINRLDSTLGSADHARAAQSMIEGAITLVRDRHNVLPLKLPDERKVLFLTIVDSSDGWRDGNPGQEFLAGLVARHPNTTSAAVTERTSASEFTLIKKMASLADAVIVNGFIRVSAFKGSIDLSAGEVDLLKHLSSLDKPFVFVLFGSPYLISFVPELPTYILAYEYYPAVEEASLRAVFGEVEFKGKLPVELPGFYPIGYSAVKARSASNH